MIQGNDIICFSNDWDADPLSKKHIVLRLAKKNRVLWVNGVGLRKPTASAKDLRRIVKKVREFWHGCREVSKNIFVFTPLVIPFHGSRFARWVNRRFYAFSMRRACRKLGFRKPITWTFTPTSAEVVGSLGERMIIYHCVDDFSKFTGADERAVHQLELKLMENADLVVVSSSKLYEAKRGYNPNTFLVTHGVDFEHFRNACSPSMVPPVEVGELRHPVIGFFGLVADWVDLEVFRFLAVSRPEWSILLIGEVQTDVSILDNLPNVHILGRRSYQDLPAYCKAFDVAILPFVVNELTLAANPLKMREYLAAGLPVVATPLPEVQKLNGLLRTASTKEEFLTGIEGFLTEGRGGPDQATSKLMEPESWDAKVEDLSRLISAADRGGAAIPVMVSQKA